MVAPTGFDACYGQYSRSYPYCLSSPPNPQAERERGYPGGGEEGRSSQGVATDVAVSTCGIGGSGYPCHPRPHHPQ